MIFNKWPSYFVLILLGVILFPRVAHALPGDLNSSGRVDGYDLIIFSRAYGSITGEPEWNPVADLDANGVIDQADLDILSYHFGKRGVSFGLWVGDQWSGTERVSRLSHTGNLLGRVGSFNYPFSISSNVSDGTVWVADYNDDKVVKLSPVDGATLITVSGMDAYSVSVNANDGSVWVADYYNNRVVKLLPSIIDGYSINTGTGSHIIINGFNRPRAVSVIPETGVVWVADSYNDRIVRLYDDISDGYDISANTGSHVVKSGFLKPYGVSANVSDGTVWVADYDNNDVVKLSSSGLTEIVRVGGFNQPFALAVNYIDDSVWIADRGNDRVVRLGADGSFLVEITGVGNPYSISVNPLNGHCWVAEYDNHQVVEYSPAGMEISRLSGFTNPLSVCVTPEEASGSTYPSAESSLSSNTVNVGETVDFNGSGSDPDGEIIKYEWDFDGDGTFDYSSSETGNTSHAYSNAGIYNPVFRVTDSQHLTATDYSQLVRVGNLETMAGADTTSGSAPLTVNFTAGYVDPLDGYIDTYQWDFDGDNLFEYYDESTGDTSHTYSEAGTYTALLKITDGEFTAIDTITISVSSSLPSASASASPEEGKPPLSVGLSGSGTDPDGSIVLFEWDFDGDGTYDWHSVSGGNTTHNYDASGFYNARFRVTDNDGNTDTQEIMLKVTPVAVANADLTEGHGPLLVTFNANGSHDDNGSITNYEWDFGECVFYDAMESGTSNWTADAPWAQINSDYYSRNTSWTDSPAGDYASYADTALTSSAIDLSTVSSATITFRHHYETQSNYDFCGVEISTDGGSNWTELASYSGTLESWSEVRIDISSYLPSGDCKIRFRLTSNSGTNYDGWYVDDVSICSENWVPSTDGTASHPYNNPGAYTATLRVTDNDSIQALDTIEIKVIQTGLPIAAASADIETGIAPLTVNFSGAGSDPGGSITSYKWNFGEEYVWIADYGSHQVFHLAPDGSDLAGAGGFYNPISVSVNSDDGTVWVADHGNNQVVRLAADGTELARLGGFSYPYSVSVNPTDGTVWVADNGHHDVVKLNPDGSEIIRAEGFYNPYSVSLNPADGSVWVADYNQDQVVKLLPSVTDGYNIGTDTGSHAAVKGVDNPVSVSVNSADDSVW
ncbi:PKD domain-containing protein, partial [Thermodesulfobacteriota bacterium]